MKDQKDFQSTEDEEGKMSQWISVQQGILEPWLDEVDIIDGAIVGYVLNWLNAPKVQRHPADDRFIWINLGYLLKCLPILHIEYRTLERHIKKLDDLRIIERKYTADSRTGQKKLFIRVVPHKIVVT